jgi:glucose-6-phosphate dehydrogenase assembly protein OpcA
MEDVVSTGHMLPAGETVPFRKAAEVLAENQARSRAASRGRALTATIVVVAPSDRLPDAGDALCDLAEAIGVRAILISPGSNPVPPVEVQACTIALAGMTPEYVNNAVAALRLSSLPTLVWWRGGDPALLDGLADLAERVVLDDEADPLPGWRRAVALAQRSAFSDLRWTRLTRWRALMAHFFDMPGIRAAMPTLTSLRVRAGDRHSAALFAAWLQPALAPARITTEILPPHGDSGFEEAQLRGPGIELTLRLAASHACVEASAVGGAHSASRTVSLGDSRLPTLMAEELRVRARDAAFERAIRAVIA